MIRPEDFRGKSGGMLFAFSRLPVCYIHTLSKSPLPLLQGGITAPFVEHKPSPLQESLREKPRLLENFDSCFSTGVPLGKANCKR